jgi:hypothetical protein
MTTTTTSIPTVPIMDTQATSSMCDSCVLGGALGGWVGGCSKWGQMDLGEKGWALGPSLLLLWSHWGWPSGVPPTTGGALMPIQPCNQANNKIILCTGAEKSMAGSGHRRCTRHVRSPLLPHASPVTEEG